MLTLSITTWVLITGLLLIRLKTISFLNVALSKAYKTTFESTKISSFVRFITVKFKVTHVYTMGPPEFEGDFRPIKVIFSLFNRKSNNLYLLPDKVVGKFNSLFFTGRYNDFTIHRKISTQIYQITF